MRQAGEWIHGKYQVERVLGSGGMGTVYATKRRNGSRAAVKVLHRRLAVDRSIRARFVEEGYLANRVDHPAIVTILEEDIDEEGNFYLVMEQLDGVDLGQFVAPPRSPISTAEALNIADQLLSALAVAHQKGIVHRDIKPANLMILRDGRLKLLDFGIAQALNTQLKSASSEEKDEEADEDDLVLGTDRYMSPEQAKGFLEEVDARSDLWAVGALLLALLADEDPHAAPLWDQSYEDRAWAFSRLGQVPPHVVQLISLALQPLKSKRWASAAAMQNALHAVHVDLYGPVQRETLAALAATKLAPSPDSSLSTTSAPELHASDTPSSSTALPSSAPDIDPTQHSSRANGSDQEANALPLLSAHDAETRRPVSVSATVLLLLLALGIGAFLWSTLDSTQRNKAASSPPMSELGAKGVTPSPPERTPLSQDKTRASTSDLPLPKDTRLETSSSTHDSSKEVFSPAREQARPTSPSPTGSSPPHKSRKTQSRTNSVGKGTLPNSPGAQKQAPSSQASTPKPSCDGLDGTFDPGLCQ